MTASRVLNAALTASSQAAEQNVPPSSFAMGTTVDGPGAISGRTCLRKP